MNIETRAGTFQVNVLTNSLLPEAVATVVIVNSLTSRMTINAVSSFRKFNDIPTNYVIVDNFSDQWVLDDLVRELGSFSTIVSNYGEPKSIKMGHWDSLLNAVGVDIGTRFCRTRYGFVCHNDVLACRTGWLRHLVERMGSGCGGASFSRDNDRIRAMHVSGYLYDAELYPPEIADWYPRPGVWDVGDHYTQLLRDAGMGYHVCASTHNGDGTAPRSESDPIIAYGRPISADCSLDDERNTLYMHMGRGSYKSIGAYNKPGKTTHDEWVEFGKWIVDRWQ